LPFLAIGGLAFFLWGVQLLSRDLERNLGKRVKNWLHSITSTPIKGFITGVVTTLLLQSSSLTTVTLVGMVNARVFSLAQAIAVIIGANVGTTITGQLLSFELHRFSLPLFTLGFLLSFLPFRKLKEAGTIIRSFAVLLVGFNFMVDGVAPLQEGSWEMLLKFQDSIVVMMGAGFAWSSVLQSSSAMMGMAMAMLERSIVGLDAAVALTVGADVGTCITAIIASFKTSLAARKTAVAHFMFNLISAVLLIIFWNLFIAIAQSTSPEITRQLANSHSLYNLLGAAIFLPLVPLWVNILNALFDKKYK